MSMGTYAACGYGLVFTNDQIEPLLEKIIATRYTNEPKELRPENIDDVLDDLNEYLHDWFIIDDDHGNFNAVITRKDTLLPEDLNNGLLYIPYGTKRVPWETPNKSKDEYIEEISRWIGDILPDNYNIDENFIFAQWCQFA